ncbi:hypothetical protein DFA_10519 [Cavenderia fasciculata]|uniref:Uncharacterized protein n=1 Tax=Cavenderia fasciculata TaxID=261658 RepID=F4QAF8_CACFS|nr:uncharacterized protein DFA_10519 [Cavenderia fasciculata]EGG15677.1 hypothetical protein DFA_10519 [Cavenderia fasciculata]|eukprot:XP_004354419.1 hypothetical protein DFA_10519 [Cavenderia fasciculata]
MYIQYISLLQVIIVFLFCTWSGVEEFAVNAFTSPRCIGMPADWKVSTPPTNPDWWFLLSKQSKDNVNGGGFIYTDSFGVYLNIDDTGNDMVGADKLTVKKFWERHTESAYENNKEIYGQCVKRDSDRTKPTLVNTRKAVCKNVRIEAQVWYHDTLGLPPAKKPKPQAQDSDAEDLNNGEQQVTVEARSAHAKYLISVDTKTGNGYFIDHSINIPSIPVDTGAEWFNPYLLFGLNVGGTEAKFKMSHHSFCSNFQQNEFDDLMGVIGRGKPHLTRTNYIDTKGGSLLPIDHPYNIKERVVAELAESQLPNDICLNFYSTFEDDDLQGSDHDVEETTQGTTERERIGAFIRHNNNDPVDLCLTEITTGPLQFLRTIYGFDIRMKPVEFVNPGLSIVRTRWLDDTPRKEVGDMKTYIQLGLDPFTYIAKANPSVYYVSTYSQPNRVDVPSIHMVDQEWGIFNIREWKYDNKIQRDRHEKLSFSTANGRVCVGDANRNLVHTHYAGIYICFTSQRLANELYALINLVDVSNSYFYDNQGNLLSTATNDIQDSLPTPFPKWTNRVDAKKRSLPSLMYPLVARVTYSDRPKRNNFIGDDGQLIAMDDRPTKKAKFQHNEDEDEDEGYDNDDDDDQLDGGEETNGYSDEEEDVDIMG